MQMTLDLGSLISAGIVAVLGYFLKGLADQIRSIAKTQQDQSLSLTMNGAAISELKVKLDKLPEAVLVEAKMKAAFEKIDLLKGDIAFLKEFSNSGHEVHELLRKRVHRMHGMIMELKYAGEQSDWKSLTKGQFWSLDEE